MTSPRPVVIYADVVCDLFHAGHVEFLRKARELGDRLIVGLVSDADVATYKPAPIMTFAERAAVVRACRYVDEVLDEPSPLLCTCALLDRIGADFACHGDDLAPADVVYFYGDVMAAGRLKVLRYTAGISSRQIVSRVVQRYREGTLRDAI